MIQSFFHKLYALISIIKSRFIPLEELGNPLSSPIESSVKEDIRDKKTRKRVAEAFKKQESQYKIRALKPHDPTCKDPLMCKQVSCFNRVPDKIVSDPYSVKKKIITDETMGSYAKPKRRMRKSTCRKKIYS